MKQNSKKDALRILIENSIMFDDDQKEVLLSSVDNYSDQEVDSLGIMLALEQKQIKKYSQEELIKKAKEFDNQIS
ncbi:MAG: hypothetical protein COV78_00720 [Candidatus Pacebacteria bacterium CG11_big_fil_rev_8_21_14_0_20_34_55]|nr:MAG: hypothetical protein COV78_00720 [Candidatus Pacebacteria bacterium CG11_big_fil_rev_8_21_14_0_20_34_55]